jgi:hypothetical protein
MLQVKLRGTATGSGQRSLLLSIRLAVCYLFHIFAAVLEIIQIICFTSSF